MNVLHRPIIVGITGASGALYVVRLIETLLSSGRDVHLAISPSGYQVLEQELGCLVPREPFVPASLLRADFLASLPPEAGRLHYHDCHDFMAPIASGTFVTGGMVVCPCSGTTLSAIATGASGNLIQRAAEVHLKERRRLVLVPREAPLSLPAIDNMRRAAEAGATILPASPGWYHGVKTIDDLVNFIVSRILDQLDIENDLIPRWGSM